MVELEDLLGGISNSWASLYVLGCEFWEEMLLALVKEYITDLWEVGKLYGDPCSTQPQSHSWLRDATMVERQRRTIGNAGKSVTHLIQRE